MRARVRVRAGARTYAYACSRARKRWRTAGRVAHSFSCSLPPSRGTDAGLPPLHSSIPPSSLRPFPAHNYCGHGAIRPLPHCGFGHMGHLGCEKFRNKRGSEQVISRTMEIVHEMHRGSKSSQYLKRHRLSLTPSVKRNRFSSTVRRGFWTAVLETP